jgi:hypothetical protein
MSFDLYLVCYANQRPSGVPRSAILEAFGDQVRWEDDYSGRTHDRYCSIDLGRLKSEPDLISCVSINRPLADQRFLASLYKIMELDHGAFCVAMVFPGDKGPLVASLSAASHLSEHLGQPIVVHNAAEILEQIESS